MRRDDCTIGMEVVFGRQNGQKTRGIVRKMNQKTAKVETLESRGVQRSHEPGEVWKVHYSLMEPVSESNNVPGSNPIMNPLPDPTALGDNSGVLIMKAIAIAYGELSPENLTGDGELPVNHVRRKATALNKRLKHLQDALDRRVTETEAYQWERERQKFESSLCSNSA